MGGRKCEPGCTCRRHSVETKEKLRRANLGKTYIRTDEFKSHLSIVMTGRKKSPESIEKNREYHNRPEVKEKSRQNGKEQFVREGGSEARSNRMKKIHANRSPEEKRAITAKAQATRKANGPTRWTDDRRERFRASIGEYWDSRSEEFMKEWGERSARTQASQSGQTSSLELEIEGILQFLGIQYEAQKVIDSACVDFYLVDFQIVLEADGTYWHPDSSADKRRDDLLRNSGFIVVRLSEVDISRNAVQSVVNALLQGSKRGV